MASLFLAALALPAGRAPRLRSEAGATLRFDLAADPRTLNPLFLAPDAASVEQQVARLVFEPFIDLDAQGRPQAALLSEIPTRANGDLSADGRTIRYRLRPGVRWSDGVPVTAADVLFTLRAILDPSNPVRSHEGYDFIDRAYALNPRTVLFHLRRAWAPAVMTYFSYGFSAAVRVAGARLARRSAARARTVQRRADCRRRPVSFSFVAARRRIAICGQPALLARQTGGRESRR